MEVVNQQSMRTSYYFSLPDQEILDEHILNLSHDEDTWLYEMKDLRLNMKHEIRLSSQNKYKPTTGGSVDSRTFTRRKDPSSFDNNRSSLGLLSSSKLLNDSLTVNSTPKPESLEKTFSSSTVSDMKPVPPRVFKLDTPFMNSASLERNIHHSKIHTIHQRFKFDSESSDTSVSPSLENFSPFEKNEVMTDSLVNFLEKQEVNCRPPTAFQDDEIMVDSIVSLSGNNDIHSIVDINGKSESMTASLVQFLEPVNCKPPLGFEDNDMGNSMVNVQDSDDIPACDITCSLIDFLENVPTNSTTSITKSTVSETENIPPNGFHNQHTGATNILNCNDKLKTSDFKSSLEIDEQNSTFDLGKSGNNKCNETFTKSIGDYKTRQDNSDKCFRNQTINQNDFNVGLANNVNRPNNEFNKIILARNGPNKINSTLKRYGTYVKSETSEALTVTKQVPQRNSTFNTTFTKIDVSTKGLNTTFNKSTDGLNGGLEDDQTSSASDSSFSSSSTKPRSIDELRSIVQQQENSLVQQTSTPTDTKIKATSLANMDFELSPIRRLSNSSCRNNESRSANSSPVRNSTKASVPFQHRLTNLQQSTLDSRRQMLQASSLSNIARPKVSGLRLPQPVSKFSVPKKNEPRPISVPPPTGIPRPQGSRLPLPRFRGSGIPGLNRGGKC